MVLEFVFSADFRSFSLLETIVVTRNWTGSRTGAFNEKSSGGRTSESAKTGVVDGGDGGRSGAAKKIRKKAHAYGPASPTRPPPARDAVNPRSAQWRWRISRRVNFHNNKNDIILYAGRRENDSVK